MESDKPIALQFGQKNYPILSFLIWYEKCSSFNGTTILCKIVRLLPYNLIKKLPNFIRFQFAIKEVIKIEWYTSLWKVIRL